MHPLLQKKRRVASVTIDGTEYFVRSWSLAERIEFGAAEGKRVGVLGVRFSLCDAQGVAVFTDKDDVAIAEMDGQTAETIAEAAFKLNKLKAEAAGEEKKD